MRAIDVHVHVPEPPRVPRWLNDFEKLEIKPEVRQKILLDNARKLLKL